MRHYLLDQVQLLAGELSRNIEELLNGRVEAFVLSSRDRRHLWLALTAISPATAKSGLVRYGWDADPEQLSRWVLDVPPPMLWPVLRRCMPAAALSKSSYSQIAAHLGTRPRSGRVWCQVGSMTSSGWAAALALPPDLTEQSVIMLMDGNVSRAEALRDLWALALDQGRDPSNLRRAICRATDMSGLEALLIRTVQADQLPAAPTPAVPSLLPIRTAKQLGTYGFALRNCMARARGGFGLRERNRAFFMWLGDIEGPVMISAAPDHLGWRLAEVRLAQNKRPSERLRRRIAEAFETVGVRDRPDLNDLLLAL